MDNAKSSTTKTKEEVLGQLYVSAYDMQVLNPTMTYQKALDYIKAKRTQMEEKKLYVPNGKTKVALTSFVRKDCGF